MVTHELAHKPFADRVVWMRDGKIQTVENIPARKRADAHAKLEAEFAVRNRILLLTLGGMHVRL